MMDTPVPPHAPGQAPGPQSGQAPGQPVGQPPGPASAGPVGDRPAGAAPSRPSRRRDRHGRGMRGPIAPPQVPLAVSRSEAFDDLVRDAADRLERRWPQLSEVEFAVQEVPPTVSGEQADGQEAAVPLGRLVSAGSSGRNSPHRIVIYRRPVELRAKSRDERALLVHEVVVEQVAELLGLSPETVDPRYGED